MIIKDQTSLPVQEPRYKVGDKVQIKERTRNCSDYPISFTTGISSLKNKNFIIKRVIPALSRFSLAFWKEQEIRRFYNGDNYIYELENCNFCFWHSSMFVPVIELKQVNVPTILKHNETANLINNTVTVFKTRNGAGYYLGFHFTTTEHHRRSKEFYTPEIIQIAKEYGGEPSAIYYMVFPSLISLTNFVNEVNNKYSTKTQNNNESRLQNQKLLSQETIDEKEVQFAVRDTKLQLQSDLLATEQSLAKKNVELEGVKTEYPFDTKRYIAIINEIEGLKEGIKHIQALQKEFGF